MTESVKKPKILCVDDEPEVLQGLKLQLRKAGIVKLAEGGAEGLAIIKEKGPFDIVISDMRMPEMNGAEFLTQVRKSWPETQRILLTGQADIESTVAAVNEGGIFRFLMKPCSKEQLLDAVNDAFELRQLRSVERNLLEGTLQSALGVVNEILAIVSPPAFQSTRQIESIVRQLSLALELPDAWQYNVAASLSQVGCVSVPLEILDRLAAGETLEEADAEAYRAHTELGHQLVDRIPRLGFVAEMIRDQLAPCAVDREAPPSSWGPAAVGAEMLRAATGVERALGRGETVGAAIAELKKLGDHPLALLDALEGIEVEEVGRVRESVTVAGLSPGMVLQEDVLSAVDVTLAKAGMELNASIIQRLRNSAARGGVKEPISVMVPNVPV